MMDGKGYAALVLHGVGAHGLGAPAGVLPPKLNWSAAEGPLAALCLAGTALQGRRLPEALGDFGAGMRRGWEIAPGRLLVGLEALHRGFIGDYVTWLVAVAAMLAVVFTWLS